MPAVQFVVEGGRPLSGSIRPSGNKNAALPIVAAALISENKVHLENVPRIRDIETLVELIRSVGASMEWVGRNSLDVHAKDLRPADLNPTLCAKIRASILLAAPLLARCGQVTLPPPGGDVIGRRRLDTHFLRFLIALGAEIEGVGTNTMTIQGGRPLGTTSVTHAIGPDHIEVGSFIGLAAVTKSELRIENAGVEHLRSTLMGFSRLGIECKVDGPDLIVPAKQSRQIQADMGGHVPKLEDQPWPAFPADTMSIAIVTATQCDGLILMHEKMFESRMFFVDKLSTMGARIVLCDPHRALIHGPSRLRGAFLESPDIRAGMALLLAALCAEGTSFINNVGQIERGYERIDERLNALGAAITRVDDRRQ